MSTDKLIRQPKEDENEKYQEYSYRCETISFNLSPEIKPTEVKLNIDYIQAVLTEGEGCFEGIEAVQYLLDFNNTGIKAGCVKNDFEYMTPSSYVILEKPDSLTIEEAMKIVTTTSGDLSRVYGPWVFSSQVIQEPSINTPSTEATLEETTTPTSAEAAPTP